MDAEDTGASPVFISPNFNLIFSRVRCCVLLNLNLNLNLNLILNLVILDVLEKLFQQHSLSAMLHDGEGEKHGNVA